MMMNFPQIYILFAIKSAGDSGPCKKYNYS